jgi:PAS domain S-box-containing protein
MVIVGLVGVYTSRHIQNHLEETIEHDVKPASIVGVVARRVGFIHSNSLLHLFSRSVEDMTRYESEIADWEGKISTDLDALENTFKDQVTLDKLAEFRTAWETYLRIWNKQVVPLSRANRGEDAFALARKGGAAGMAAQKAMYNLDELHDSIIAAADDSMKLSEQDYRKSQNILLAVILLTIILGLAFGMKSSSLIAGAVNTVSKAAQLVAAGDLDQRVTVRTGDEIESMADSFNTMTSNLKRMVEELKHEISERKRAEEALRESEQWLSTTLRSIGDAVIVTDAKGLVTLMNPVAEDLTGWDETEAVGKPLEDVLNIINEQTGELAENPVARVLREGVVVGLANHTVLIAKDGTKRPISDSGAPMRDEEGNVIGTVMVFRDITELKQLEEQLVRKEKLATIGQLASGVGHELRNPLGVIGNSAYYLNMKLKDADEKVRKHIEILQREVHRANRIISDLLDFSRVSPPALETCNVNSIIKDTLADLKLPENISLETQLNDELPGILVDPDQIRQVFLNLSSNAVQAMPEGGRLEIKTGVKDDFAEIMLRDTGEGIPKEHLQKIFDPLFTKKAKGIGLGLSIVKGIVEGHKGTIEVESEVGEGTTFTIKLPFQSIEEEGG